MSKITLFLLVALVTLAFSAEVVNEYNQVYNKDTEPAETVEPLQVTNPRGIALIKSFEGLRLCKYKDPLYLESGQSVMDTLDSIQTLLTV
jgi:hypothetical protein